MWSFEKDSNYRYSTVIPLLAPTSVRIKTKSGLLRLSYFKVINGASSRLNGSTADKALARVLRTKDALLLLDRCSLSCFSVGEEHSWRERKGHRSFVEKVPPLVADCYVSSSFFFGLGSSSFIPPQKRSIIHSGAIERLERETQPI